MQLAPGAGRPIPRSDLWQLWRSPAFALVAILALGIGVGANITIFLFVNQWLLRPIDAIVLHEE